MVLDRGDRNVEVGDLGRRAGRPAHHLVQGLPAVLVDGGVQAGLDGARRAIGLQKGLPAPGDELERRLLQPWSPAREPASADGAAGLHREGPLVERRVRGHLRAVQGVAHLRARQARRQGDGRALDEVARLGLGRDRNGRGVEADPADAQGPLRALEHHAHPIGPGGRHREDPLAPDRRPTTDLAPGLVQPGLHAERLHALAERDVLHHLHAVEAGRLTQTQLDPAILSAVVGRPEATRLVAEHHRRCIGRIPAADVRGQGGRASRKIAPEGAPDELGKLLQTGHVVLVDEPAPIDGQVQQQIGAAPDGAQPDLLQVVEGLDLVVLARVVVPARTDRDVGLARDPGVAVLVPDVELGRALGGPHEVLGAPVGVPVRLPGDAALVADPAQVRTAPVEDDRVRLVLVDGALEEVPVVLLALPVRALATRAVEPDLEDGPVAREDLGELRGEVLVVGLAVAVARLGPIPRRQVQPELEPLGPARLRELGQHVPLAVPPGAAGHVVLGDVARPQAEPVVVLGGQDHGLHAGLLGHAHPLVTVELRGREGVRRLGAVPPLLVGERVHVEVHERVVLQLVPGELRTRGQRQDRLRRRHLGLDGRAALEGGGDRLLDAREE